MLHPRQRRIQPGEMIENRAAGINVERRAVGDGQRVQINVFTVEGTVFVGKSMHRGTDIPASARHVKQR